MPDQGLHMDDYRLMERFSRRTNQRDWSGPIAVISLSICAIAGLYASRKDLASIPRLVVSELYAMGSYFLHSVLKFFGLN